MLLPRLSLSLVPLPTTPDCLTCQRPLLLLWDSPLVPEPESSRLVVNVSLWTNWLSELQRVKTLWSWEVQETPEKPSDTSVWVHTRTRPQESCLRVESSNLPEVEEDLRVSRSKLTKLNWLIKKTVYNTVIYSLAFNCFCIQALEKKAL